MAVHICGARAGLGLEYAIGNNPVLVEDSRLALGMVGRGLIRDVYRGPHKDSDPADYGSQIPCVLATTVGVEVEAVGAS